MRFTLLCASTALAASLLLSACSGGAGSSSAIPNGGSTTSMAKHHGPHLVSVGNRRPQSCTSPYYYCYLVAPGTTTQFGWCISYSGNCTSGVLTDKIKWFPTNLCAPSAKTNGPNGCTGKVKSLWGPPKAVVGLQEDNVIVKANVPYTGGTAGYDATWNACDVKGTYKGSCFGPVPTGIIVGPY